MRVIAGGDYRIGTRASPIPSTYTARLRLNKSAALSDGKYGFNADAGSYLSIFGATKTPIATLTAQANAAATSATVSAATGWAVGDEIYLCNTKQFDTGHDETVTLSGSYTPGSTTLALSSGLSFQHLNECPVVNLTSNVTVGPYDNNYRPFVRLYIDTTSVTDAHDFGYCTFDRIGYAGESRYGVNIWAANSIFGLSLYPAQFKEFKGVKFVSRTNDYSFCQFFVSKLPSPIPFNDCAFVSNNQTAGSKAIWDCGFTSYTNCLVAASATITPDDSQNGTTAWSGSWTGGWISTTAESYTGITSAISRNVIIRGATFLGPSNDHVVATNSAGAGPINWQIIDCDVAETFPRDSSRYALRSTVSAAEATLTLINTYTGSYRPIAETAQAVLTSNSYVKAINRNRDVTLQEEYYRTGTVTRDNSVKNRSTSSLRMTPITANTAFTRSFTIAVAAGEVLRLIGYCRYDSTYYNSGTGFVAPTMTISGTINGVTLTPVTYTAPSANAGNWDLIDASITNSAGAAGDLTVTFFTQCTPTTGNVYWDGIVVAPMVVSARHYGFVFDEANPKRTVNVTTSASESTAGAYTGMTLTSSSITLSASKTFQVLYDYSQYWGVTNQSSAMPLTGVGAAGSPAMFARAPLTTTGFTLNGPGSIGMGSYTLTGSVPFVYTYTGGTFSQLTTVPSFNGGQLNIGAAGTYTFNGASMIVSMTPTAPGTYALGGGSFAGTIDLRNTAAHAITVQVPAGTTTTTASNTGGAITVSAATATLTIDANVSLVGAEIRIYDLDNSPAGSLGTELTGTESAPSSTYAYAGTAGNLVWLQIMLAGYEEFGQSLTLPSVSTTFTAQLKLDGNA